jgi:5'-deoxynucleotidase YfbR-like HD superfamily hydrolase
MSWILTFSGRRFDLLAPTAGMISPIDIAHALSLLCRFNGHTSQLYSVAHHSLLVADLVPAEDQLAALLHDATEAYLGDMTRPLKAALPEYKAVEHNVWLVICERFNIDPVLPASVHHADLVALATERRDLMPRHPEQWERLKGVIPCITTITPLRADVAKNTYFNRLLELMQAAHRKAVAA